MRSLLILSPLTSARFMGVIDMPVVGVKQLEGGGAGISVPIISLINGCVAVCLRT